MSYIEQELENNHTNKGIQEYLEEEGFKEGVGWSGKGEMYYEVTGRVYTVCFSVSIDYILVEVVYTVGGFVTEKMLKYDERDFDSFLGVYKEAIEFAKYYIRNRVLDV